MSMLYWAYGSNLNVRQMRLRCPRATKMEALTVKNLVLRFRGVADVAQLNGARIEGGLWWITDECEAALDTYEGVSSRMYEKRYFNIEIEGDEFPVLYYKMLARGIMPPSDGYLRTIEQGYRDFDLDLTRLIRAVEHSWDRKNKTPAMRARKRREKNRQKREHPYYSGFFLGNDAL